MTRFSYSRGRRYHSMPSSPYFMPNDSEEMDRLDYQHYLILAVVGRKHVAPLRQPRRVLDVGTGTGIWMLEMAAELRDCEFVGLDIAPLQPEAVVPNNCHFKIKNVVDAAGIPYPENTFDFVHHRLLLTAFTKKDWPDYVQDCARVIAPGGWLEISEMTGLLTNPGIQSKRMHRIVQLLCLSRGIEPDLVLRIDTIMEKAHLENIHIDVFKIPVGAWGGQIGTMAWNNYRSAFTAVAPLLAAIEDVSESNIIELIDEIGREVNTNRCCWEYYCYYGQKSLQFA
ncbi:S-adenosyl-L-methionine-dependent methyltransferase [Syncephalis fuscata]|nr:S-adenosyl-L-methionine-dependent methyltransferase [Syncephalis fuscata]